MSEIPIYFTAYIPKEFQEQPWMDRWFMRDEAYLLALKSKIESRLAQLISEEERRMLSRSLTMSIIPALDSISSRSSLTWADLEDIHKQFAIDGNKWLSTNCGYEYDWKHILVNSPLTHAESALGDDNLTIWLDNALTLINGEPRPNFTPLPNAWLATAPLGYGLHPNRVLPVVSKEIHNRFPDVNYQPDPAQAPNWWRWRTTNLDGKEMGSVFVTVVGGGGWYGTWPRVKGYETQNSVGIYGADYFFRAKLTGIPDPFKIMWEEPTKQAAGESHEVHAHGIGNVSCHSDMTGLTEDSWTTIKELTGPFNGYPLAADGGGGWFLGGQLDQLFNAAHPDGIGHNPILRKVQRPLEISLSYANSMMTPIVGRWPFPTFGEIRWYLNGLEIARKNNSDPIYIPQTAERQVVSAELRGGVNMHGYGPDGAIYFGAAIRVIPAFAVELPPPPPPPPPVPEPTETSILSYPANIWLKVGQEQVITTNVYLSDGTTKIVDATLASSNTKIVKTDGQKIIAVSRKWRGKTKATVTASYHGFTAYIQVEVVK